MSITVEVANPWCRISPLCKLPGLYHWYVYSTSSWASLGVVLRRGFHCTGHHRLNYLEESFLHCTGALSIPWRWRLVQQVGYACCANRTVCIRHPTSSMSDVAHRISKRCSCRGACCCIILRWSNVLEKACLFHFLDFSIWMRTCGRDVFVLNQLFGHQKRHHRRWVNQGGSALCVPWYFFLYGLWLSMVL